jgi:hypothetical protein
MKEEENIHEELRGLSDRFAQWKAETKDPMSVPDGYFDSLESKVLARLDAEGTRVPATDAPTGWALWLSPTRLSAAAAAVVLLATAIWWMRPQPAQESITDLATEIDLTSEMAEAYVQEHISDFEEELLASELEAQLADAGGEDTETGASAPNIGKPKEKPKRKKLDEDLEEILDDLTDEELEELL